MNPHAALAALLALTSLPGLAQNVALVGVLGGKALVTVDGGRPKTMVVGETYQGARLLSVQSDEAVFEVAGQRHTARLGQAPIAADTAAAAEASASQRIVLSAGNGGHFFAMGQINGKAAPMVVDTGATNMALSAAEAQRIGLNYRNGKPLQITTANGAVPAWQVRLDSVRVGDVVVYGVDAVVTAASMPYVLLGNSFLSRFQMTRSNEQMVLERRY